jgi:hypothetical protein
VYGRVPKAQGHRRCSANPVRGITRRGGSLHATFDPRLPSRAIRARFDRPPVRPCRHRVRLRWARSLDGPGTRSSPDAARADGSRQIAERARWAHSRSAAHVAIGRAHCGVERVTRAEHLATALAGAMPAGDRVRASAIGLDRALFSVEQTVPRAKAAGLVVLDLLVGHRSRPAPRRRSHCR